MKIDSFFRKMERLGLALTYSDVRLKTGYSGNDPYEASLETYFSRHIPLKCPLVSAAMDTVTEAPMAIAMAEFGGLGILHKVLLPEAQAAAVRRVKLHLNDIVERPICVSANETIGAILEQRRLKGYSFESFPVLDNAGKVVGLLTRKDFERCAGDHVRAKQAMTPLKKLVIAKQGTSAAKARAILTKERKEVLPLITSTGELAGMYVFSDLKRHSSNQTSLYNIDAEGHLRVGAAIDTGAEEVERAERLLAAGCDVLVIDKAHGDMRPVREMMRSLRSLRRAYPGRDVVIGNISEPESAIRLAQWGADGIKVGQGPGSICTTRDIAGIGCPQLTAVYKCAKALRGKNIPLCADGGITRSGDIPVALGTGASSVMIGRMLAGTDETPGEIKDTRRGRVKVYRGMGSLEAMKESRAASARYRQGNTPKEKLVAEGVVSTVPYQGPVYNVLVKHIGGLRAGMGYVGAASIPDLQRKADFLWHSAAAQIESHPHDVTVTDETQ